MAQEGAPGSAAVCGGVSPDARLVVAERQYQQGVQAIRVRAVQRLHVHSDLLCSRLACNAAQRALRCRAWDIMVV